MTNTYPSALPALRGTAGGRSDCAAHELLYCGHLSAGLGDLSCGPIGKLSGRQASSADRQRLPYNSARSFAEAY